MTSHYSVVQYAPDPAADERINIGVLAYSGDDVEAHFLSNWRRVQSFGGEKVGFLKTLAREILEAVEDQGSLPGVGSDRITEDDIRDMADKWSYAIRVTPPRVSTKEPSELVEYISDRFLVEREKRNQPRTRRTAASTVAKGVKRALIDQVGEIAKEITHRNAHVTGDVESHPFDVVVENGTPLLTGHGFSFEPRETKRLETNFEAILYRIEDVRNVNEEIPIGLLALPPDRESELWARAKKVIPDHGADIVLENDLEDWASEKAEEVAEHLPLVASQ